MTALIERASDARSVMLTVRVETVGETAEPMMAATEVLATPNVIRDVLAALAPHMPGARGA